MARATAAPGASCTKVVDAATGRIVASLLTSYAEDDGSQVDPLLDRVSGTVAAVIADGADDPQDAYDTVHQRQPAATVVMPSRSTAVPSDTADVELTLTRPPFRRSPRAGAE